MKTRGLVRCFLFLCLLQTLLCSEPKGLGFDIIYPQLVSDPDNVHDEGGYAVNYTYGFGGDQTSNSLMVNYLLRSLGPKSNLSVGFLYFSYDASFSQNGATASVKGSELQFNLFFTRSLIRNNLDEDGFESWRPSNWNLSYYVGLGYAPAKLDVNISGPNPLPQVPKLGDNFRASTSESVSGASLPFLLGLIGTYSISEKHGLEYFINVDQHIETEKAGFDAGYVPAFNIGANYFYRANATKFFPFEYSAGLLINTLSNDVEDGPGFGLTFGIRKRY